MFKDIFVDNNVAKNFCNPLDIEYRAFIKWLYKEGALVVSNKVIVEYHRSTSHSYSCTNIIVIIDRLLRDGRLNKISNYALKRFAIKKHILNTLRSNPKDHEHLKIVLLSVRKLALSMDKSFRFDVNNYPGYLAFAASRPNEIPYV